MIERRNFIFLMVSVVAMLALLGAAVFGQVPQKGDTYRYLSIFSEVFSLVRTNYVEEVPPEQLVDGAFSGITDAVDEYSYYVPPAQMASYKTFSEQDGPGTGIVSTKRYGYAYVIAVVDGSPADRAGVEAGDFIERIDGQPTQKMAIWQIELGLRGREGKPIELAVLRGGMSKREIVKVTPRAFIPEIPQVKYYGTVAYVRIPFFGKGAAEAFARDLAEVRKAGRTKLIVDVRGNASGSIDEAISAADQLLARGTITTLTGRRVEPKHWDADPATAFDGKIEVLTDTSTASGAEVFAAGISENKRGSIVGVPSYGKAIVQKFIALPSGGGLFMTIAHYTTPDLRPIKERGIKPDVLVDLALGAGRADADKEDLILKKALSLYGETMPVEAKEKAAA